VHEEGVARRDAEVGQVGGDAVDGEWLLDGLDGVAFGHLRVSPSAGHRFPGRDQGS
jgi:hypothetical protein